MDTKVKNLDRPDERPELPKGRAELVHLGDFIVVRGQLEPGCRTRASCCRAGGTSRWTMAPPSTWVRMMCIRFRRVTTPGSSATTLCERSTGPPAEARQRTRLLTLRRRVRRPEVTRLRPAAFANGEQAFAASRTSPLPRASRPRSWNRCARGARAVWSTRSFGYLCPAGTPLIAGPGFNALKELAAQNARALRWPHGQVLIPAPNTSAAVELGFAEMRWECRHVASVRPLVLRLAPRELRTHHVLSQGRLAC
jgi:hypothetical protein